MLQRPLRVREIRRWYLRSAAIGAAVITIRGTGMRPPSNPKLSDAVTGRGCRNPSKPRYVPDGST